LGDADLDIAGKIFVIDLSLQCGARTRILLSGHASALYLPLRAPVATSPIFLTVFMP